MRNLKHQFVVSAWSIIISGCSLAYSDPLHRSAQDPAARSQLNAVEGVQQGDEVIRDPFVRADDAIRVLFYQHAAIPLSGGRIEDGVQWSEAPVPTVEIVCPQRKLEISFPWHPESTDNKLVCGSSPTAASRAVRVNSRLITSYRIGSSRSTPLMSTVDLCLRDLFEDAKTVEVTAFYCATDVVQMDIEVLRETRSGRTALAQSTDRVTLELSNDLASAYLIGVKDNADEMRRQRERLNTGQDCTTQTFPCSEAARAARLREYRNAVADMLMKGD